MAAVVEGGVFRMTRLCDNLCRPGFSIKYCACGFVVCNPVPKRLGLRLVEIVLLNPRLIVPAEEYELI